MVGKANNRAIEDKEYDPDDIVGRYLCPRSDRTFRRICGLEKNKDIAKSVFNSMLDLKCPIVDLKILGTHRIAETPDFKETVLDVFAEDSEKRQFILEIQLKGAFNFGHRALRYLSEVYSSQIRKGEDYGVLKKCYLLAITDKDIFPNFRGYSSTHKLIETSTKESLLDLLEIRFYESKKFDKGPEELEDIGDVWLYFFMKWDYITGEIPDAFRRYEVVMKAVNELDRANWTREDLIAHMVADDKESAYNSSILYYRHQGREEGSDEAKHSIVIRALKKGMSLTDITELTDLTLQTVKKIKASLVV